MQPNIDPFSIEMFLTQKGYKRYRVRLDSYPDFPFFGVYTNQNLALERAQEFLALFKSQGIQAAIDNYVHAILTKHPQV